MCLCDHLIDSRVPFGPGESGGGVWLTMININRRNYARIHVFVGGGDLKGAEEPVGRGY